MTLSIVRLGLIHLQREDDKLLAFKRASRRLHNFFMGSTGHFT
jgi:hypothetical protein